MYKYSLRIGLCIRGRPTPPPPPSLCVCGISFTRGMVGDTRGIAVFAHITAELPRRLFHPLLSFSVLSPFSPSHFTFALYVYLYIYICIYVDLLYIHIYSKSSLARYSRKKPVKAK